MGRYSAVAGRAAAPRIGRARDVTPIDPTPIVFPDFARPGSSPGGRIGLDATHKPHCETKQDWHRLNLCSGRNRIRFLESF